MSDHQMRDSSPFLRETLGGERLIAVLRSTDAALYAPVIETLIASGIRAIEITLTTPGALTELPRLRDRFGADGIFGVGTVLSARSASDAIAAGARFLVTPALIPDVITTAVDGDIPIVSGAFSPTEIAETIRLGAHGVKVFPASLAGPTYFRELSGPFPGLALVPSGGIAVADVAGWLQSGAVAVSLGGSLIGDAFGGDLTGLRQRARLATDAAQGST